MAIEITMPKLSDTMTEGQFVCWRKNLGERVERGDIIAEVETDKAVMELEAFASGILIKTVAKAGETVPVGTLLGLIGEPGELPQAAETPPAAAAEAPPPEAPPEPAEPEAAAPAAAEEAKPPSESPVAQPAPAHDAGEHEKASPNVRRMAREQGIDLSQLQGSGPDGRITQEDLQLFVAKRQGKPEMAPGPAAQPEAVETKAPAEPEEAAAATGAPSAMRHAISATVSRSWAEIPHFGVTAEINMAACREIVSELKAGPQRIGYHALIIKACAAALQGFPLLHTAGAASAGSINISFAVALAEGLLMPVIRDCQKRSLIEIERESSRLAERSRAGKLSAGEMSGGGFSVSNLGMYGVDEFNALIMPGQTAILAVGSVVERPLVREGQIVVAPTMRVTLSCDHRAIDGAYAAAFLVELRRLLEHPFSLLIQG